MEMKRKKRNKSFCSRGHQLGEYQMQTVLCFNLNVHVCASPLPLVMPQWQAISACTAHKPNGNSVGEICGIITRTPKPQCSNEQATIRAEQTMNYKIMFQFNILFQQNTECALQRNKQREIKARAQQANSIRKATTTAAIRHTTQTHKRIVWKEMSWKRKRIINSLWINVSPSSEWASGFESEFIKKKNENSKLCGHMTDVERESHRGIGNAFRWDWNCINANAVSCRWDRAIVFAQMVFNERSGFSSSIANWFPISMNPTAIERIISINCVGQRSNRWHRNCRKMFVKTNLSNCGSLSALLRSAYASSVVSVTAFQSKPIIAFLTPFDSKFHGKANTFNICIRDGDCIKNVLCVE